MMTPNQLLNNINKIIKCLEEVKIMVQENKTRGEIFKKLSYQKTTIQDIMVELFK